MKNNEEKTPTRLICPLTSCDTKTMRADMEAAAALGADTVECRLDYLEHPPTAGELAHLLNDPPLEVIVTYRPSRQGGRFDGDESQRLEVLHNAAQFRPSFIDIERDVPRASWPEGKIILSHHDFQGVPGDLDNILAEMETSDADVNKIAFASAGPEDSLRALDVLRNSGKPAIALAMGEAGLLSRILGKKFGAFGTFAAMNPQAASAPGQPTIEQFKNLYRWDAIGPGTKLYGLIGDPVGHSMSPAIHNAAFAAGSVDAVYVPLPVEAGADNFNRFLDAVLARPWVDLRGFSVTIPHKENALAYVGNNQCDELTVKIAAVNTVTISPDGQLRGDNTDYAAAIDALCNTMDIPREGLRGKTVAVLGAGGASRAIVAALSHYGAAVDIYNRTVARAEKLAEEFSAKAFGLDALNNLEAEIVINCTPIGMYPNIDAAPLKHIGECVKVVFDTIYNPIETRLLQAGRAAGCLCVSGLDMFVNQGVAQFEIWIGKTAPRKVMRTVVIDRLTRKE